MQELDRSRSASPPGGSSAAAADESESDASGAAVVAAFAPFVLALLPDGAAHLGVAVDAATATNAHAHDTTVVGSNPGGGVGGVFVNLGDASEAAVARAARRCRDAGVGFVQAALAGDAADARKGTVRAWVASAEGPAVVSAAIAVALAPVCGGRGRRGEARKGGIRRGEDDGEDDGDGEADARRLFSDDFDASAAPTTSTMLFLVRNGNPKNIKDWDDLTKPGVQVVVVNPKTGGNGRMAYLAAWGYVRSKGGSDADALDFVSKMYKNVPVLARGGRDATGIFLQRNIGDVLVTFESEVVSVDNEFGKGKVDAIHPSVSIVAENPVAIVERTVNKKGTAADAKAYLDFLYSPEGQEIAAKHNIRPRNEAVLKKYAQAFKPLKLFTVDQYFGSLAEAQKVHFNDGGQFDKLYTNK